jgi:hypothetical protein
MAEQQTARFKLDDAEAQKIGDAISKVTGASAKGMVSASFSVRPDGGSVLQVDYA